MIDECLVVEFSVTGDDCPLAEAAAEAGVEVEARPPQLRADGFALIRASTSQRDPIAAILDADDRVRYLHLSHSDGRYNVRFLSKQPCVVHELVSAGFMVESLRYRDGGATFTGAVVGNDVLRGVMDTAGDTVGVTLERVYPLGAEEDAPVARRWDLTPRQETALRTAHSMGYFAVPKAATAADVAAALGISKSAFLERLRRGQSSLFAGLFGGG